MKAHELAAHLLKLPEEAIIMFLGRNEEKYEIVETVTLLDPKNSEINIMDTKSDEERQQRINHIRGTTPTWAILNLKQTVENQT